MCRLIQLENVCWSYRALGRHRVTSDVKTAPLSPVSSRTLLHPFSFSRPPTSSVPSFVLPPSLSHFCGSCCLRPLRSLLALSFFLHPLSSSVPPGSLPELISVPSRASVTGATVTTTCNAVVNQYTGSEAVTTTGHLSSPHPLALGEARNHCLATKLLCFRSLPCS
jgi:hypothetical protein